MFGKILISGEIELLTGLHIGTGGEYSAIGAVDSPVIKDRLTNQPIIPGSSLKGKMRTMLARMHNKKLANSANDDCDEIKRIFGGTNKESRLIFSDMAISNMDELINMNIYTPTETKFENTIDRLSSTANPRQIERAIRGCKFKMDIIYNLKEEDEVIGDFEYIVEGFKLLQFDYIGGSGSRGYGKIKFNSLKAENVIGDEADDFIKEINVMLKEVN